MKIIKRGINAVIPFLLANVYLLAKVPKVADSAFATDNNVADHMGYGHIGDAVAQS